MSEPRYRVAKFRGGYAVVWYDEKGTRHRRTLGEDKWKAHALAGEIVKAVSAKDGPLTVGQIVERYLDSTEALSIETMRFHWAGAKDAFAHLAPRQITEEFCKSFAADRGKQVKPGTIRKQLGIIRAALRKAKVNDAAFWFPQAPAPRDRRLTRDELAALERACTMPHLWLFVQVARYTAARAGAILSLTWQQVDLEKRRINLGGSGRQKRRAVIPLHPNLAWALALAKEGALSPFVIEYGGGRVHSVRHGFQQACAKAGLKGVTPHVLRHTAASWMAEDGVSMDEIAQFLGHTSPAITFRIYARFSPDFLHRAVKALG